MSAKIWKKPVEVRNRLSELGYAKEELLDVAEAMIGARAGCTDNDPPGAPGWSSWRMGTRRMREIKLTQEGWTRDETDQISSVLNKEFGLRVAVSNTDDGTGRDEMGIIPQNRAKKGAATDRAVQANQGSFMDVLDETLKVIPLKPGSKVRGAIATWYFCVFCDGDDYRAELSLPDGIDAGYFTGFKERIIIVGPGGGGGAALRKTERDGGDGSEFDIPVTRKRT